VPHPANFDEMPFRSSCALTLAALVVCSCAGPPAPALHRVNRKTIPHVLRYATVQDVSTLNPALSQALTLGFLSSLTMAWLVKWDANNRPYPELAVRLPSAQNGDLSRDGLRITYHLRRNVRWSDGAPFSADDVVWSIGAVRNPANDIIGRDSWEDIARVDEPDKYTVVLHLKRPYSPFVQTFFSSTGGPCVFPKHLLAKYPNINHVPYDALPVGIGPFKYREWQRASRVVLVKNDAYWRGSPKLDRIVVTFVPDLNTLLAQVRAHDVDLWFNAPGAYLRSASAVEGYRALIRPAFAYAHLDFNLTNPALADGAVRRALLLATPRQTIVEKILRNVGSLQDEAAPKTAPYYDPSIGFTPQNLARANEILDRAGWKRGADGTRARGNRRLDFTFASAIGSPVLDQEIELIRESWARTGVAVTNKRYADALLFGAPQDGGIFYNGKWDVIAFNWPIGVVGDYSGLYGCDAFIPNGQNDTHWCNRKADAAMRAFFSHYDEAARNRDDAIVLRALASDVPTIVLAGLDDTWIVSDDLRNFSPNQTAQFDNMMDVDI
jgi:peptide/nickel transport system substrate-binding protein